VTIAANKQQQLHSLFWIFKFTGHVHCIGCTSLAYRAYSKLHRQLPLFEVKSRPARGVGWGWGWGESC